MAAFQYRARSREDWERRANQSGSDFEGWLKDEYRMYSASKGENCIRILPPSEAWEGSNHYGMDVWVHYSVGPERASVICLWKMQGKSCPVCEERARAERAREDEDVVRQLKPSRRVLMFLLNRKDEAQGVLAWGMPFTLDRDITKVAKDRSTGEFFFIDEPERGYDIYFDKEGEQLTTKYTGVSRANRPSSVNPKHLEWLADNPLPEALRWRDYAEVKRLFEGTGRGEAQEPQESARPPRESARPPRESARPPRESARESARPPRAEAPAEALDDSIDDNDYRGAGGHPDTADAPPPRDEPSTRTAPLRRPGAAKPQAEDAPPFEPGPQSRAAPRDNGAGKSASGVSRADELRARFRGA
jgi:hypothetical protein